MRRSVCNVWCPEQSTIPSVEHTAALAPAPAPALAPPSLGKLTWLTGLNITSHSCFVLNFQSTTQRLALAPSGPSPCPRPAFSQGLLGSHFSCLQWAWGHGVRAAVGRTVEKGVTRVEGAGPKVQPQWRGASQVEGRGSPFSTSTGYREVHGKTTFIPL